MVGPPSNGAVAYRYGLVSDAGTVVRPGASINVKPAAVTPGQQEDDL